MAELTIPKEWVDARISDIADVDLGKTPQKKNYRSAGDYKVIKFRDVAYSGIDWSTDKAGFVGEETTKNLRELQVDDVLITASAHSSEHIGRKICFVNKIPKNYKNVFFCGELLGIRPKRNILSPKYAFLYFLSHNGYKEIQSHVKGVHLTSGQARNMSIPFASFLEQKRVIEIVEELFSDLDNAIENLKKAQEQLKIYRHAVLKGAFEGCFSKGDLDKKPWRKLTVDEIGEVITGNTPSKKEVKYYGREYPLYKPGDLDAGFVTADSADGLTSEGIEKARKLPAKSVLVTCIGATIGKTGLIRKAGACNQQINAIIPKDFMVSEYVYYYCISLQFQEQIKTNASATTLPILNKTKFQRLMFLVPTRNEQEQIVQEIESRFSVCNKLEESINENLQKAEALRQSILNQAFGGKLTEQWREDHKELISGENSTEVVLKKIKAEKEALQVKLKGKKKYD